MNSPRTLRSSDGPLTPNALRRSKLDPRSGLASRCWMPPMTDWVDRTAIQFYGVAVSAESEVTRRKSDATTTRRRRPIVIVRS